MLQSIPWNQIIYDNNMNETSGLPFLLKSVQNGNMKKIDVCLTDPPFNLDLKNNKNEGELISAESHKVFYQDDMSKDEYREWCCSWFEIVAEICDIVLIYCGNANKRIWYDIQKPLDELIYFIPFNRIVTPTAWIGRYRTILIYGTTKTFATRKFDTNVLVQKKKESKKEWIHPCPLDYNMTLEVLKQIKAENVIDPFMGSGTTAQAALAMGIPFIGYELDDTYRRDWDVRRRTVQKIKETVSIDTFFGDV